MSWSRGSSFVEFCPVMQETHSSSPVSLRSHLLLSFPSSSQLRTKLNKQGSKLWVKHFFFGNAAQAIQVTANVAFSNFEKNLSASPSSTKMSTLSSVNCVFFSSLLPERHPPLVLSHCLLNLRQCPCIHPLHV